MPSLLFSKLSFQMKVGNLVHILYVNYVGNCTLKLYKFHCQQFKHSHYFTGLGEKFVSCVQ